MALSINEHLARMDQAIRLREVAFPRAKRLYALTMASLLPDTASFDAVLLGVVCDTQSRKQIEDFTRTTDASFAGVFGIPSDSLPVLERFVAECIACGRNSCLETNRRKQHILSGLAQTLDESTYAKIAQAGSNLQRYIANSTCFAEYDSGPYLH